MSLLISAVLGGGLGYLIEKTSYQTGFLTAGCILFIVLTPLYRYLSKKGRLGA